MERTIRSRGREWGEGGGPSSCKDLIHSLEKQMEQHIQRYRLGSRGRLAMTLPEDWQGVEAGGQEAVVS